MLKEKYMFQTTEKYKSRFCKYRIFRITMNTQVNQEELLVARSQMRYQEIHSRIYKMPAEQDMKKARKLHLLEISKGL